MLSFNSLRRHASNWLLLSIPVGLAVAVHGVWIGVSGRMHQDKAALVDPAVDNTSQLVRITRRAVQQQRVAAVSLDLSDTLPPPPPELLAEGGESLPVELESDCPPMTVESGAVATEGGLMAADGQKQGNNPAQAAKSLALASGDGSPPVSMQQPDAARTLPPLDPAELPQIWRRALGVPIWPRQLGEKPLTAQFREVSKQDLEGRSVLELNQQSFEVGEQTFRFLPLGDRLLILRQPRQS